MYKVRDLVPGDISAAVRLLELCRGVADSRPVDIAKFVADTSAGSPAIVAVAGTVAEAELLLSVTVIPPAGAGRDAEIVAVDDWPPATVDGFKTTVVMSPGIAVTVTFAVVDAPPAVACTATTRSTGTLVVLTANET